MIWLHIIADLKQVDFSKLDLDEKTLKDFISEQIKSVWLTELGSFYYTFNKKNEITCVVALAESHIAFHSWPEKSYISMDAFVCNFSRDNSEKLKKIYRNFINFFKPWEVDERFIERKS